MYTRKKINDESSASVELEMEEKQTSIIEVWRESSDGPTA